VTPLKSHLQAVARTPSEGYWGGSGHGLGQTGQNQSLFYFFAQNFFVENDVLGTILRCSPLREPTLQLGRVASALVDSPQQSVEST